MAKAAAPNPFAAAKRATTTASQPSGSIYVAAPVLDANGRELFSKDQVKSAVETFVEGARQAAAADTMMSTARPIINGFAVGRFCQEWQATRKLPENPKVTAEPNGGATLNYIIQDRSIKLSDDEKSRLAGIVGANNVDECVESKEVFTLATDVLDQTVTVTNTDAKGKKTQKTDTVMNLMAEALQQRFAEHPDLLAALFTVKPVQQTAKGLITRGLELAVAGNQGVAAAARLVEFLGVIKAPLQIKPVGV